MKRRDFLYGLGSGLIATPILVKLTGCDDGEPGLSSSDGVTTDGGSGSNADGFRVFNDDATLDNHSFVVFCEDMDKAEVTYTAGGSGHTHPVTITQAQLQQVFNGEIVTIETDDVHPHTWTITMPTDGCAGPAEPPPSTDTGGGW